MAKRIIQQRRGRGTATYRVPSKSFSPKVEYRNGKGVVVDIVPYSLMDAPLAKIEYDDKTSGYIIAPEGMNVGSSAESVVMKLSEMREGDDIFAVETSPNSGPKLCRSPGSSATLVSKGKHAVVQLPSKKTKVLDLNCRATLGIAAGEGRSEKPFVKAGTRFYQMKSRGKLYPRTSGNSMNAVDHPYGGSGHGTVRKPVSRHAPPGRKIGTVSPRRTGKKK